MIVAVCDDLQADRDVLVSYCKRYKNEYKTPMDILQFANAGELLQSQQARASDLIFLDIYMEGASGMDAAHILRNKGFDGAIVFTTTSQEHYAQGYEVEALHYLNKPVTWVNFLEAIHRVRKHAGRDVKTIRVSNGAMFLDVPLDTICFIEVSGRKTILHTTRHNIVNRESLSLIEKRLGGDPFLRCYRYYIINMDHVLRLNDQGFLMTNKQLIPISRDNRREIRTHYLSYVFDKVEVK